MKVFLIFILYSKLSVDVKGMREVIVGLEVCFVLIMKNVEGEVLYRV